MTCKASQGPALPFIWANPDLPDVREDNSEEAWLAFDFWAAVHAGELPRLALSSHPAGVSVSGQPVVA